MGKGPINENNNMYFKARKRAAAYNERLYSREGAAELLGISVSTLADYELGNTKVVPVDKVVLMADLYNSPELITGYCVSECPVHGFLPLATEEKSIQGITLRLLRSFNEDELKAIKETSLDKGIQGKEAKKVLPTLHKTPPNGTIGGVFVCGGKSLNPGPSGYTAPIVTRRYLQAWQTKPRPTPRRKRRAALLRRSRRNRR